MNRRSMLLGSGLALTAPLFPDAPSRPLTNLAHLDFLRASVTPPSQAGHSTYGSGPIGVLWTYAEPTPDGTYRRLGGGTYDPSTDTYGQGAFNADDIARAAVVHLRHWRQTGSVASRDVSYALLRGLTYLQTSSGPNAGNVVLWMQPDGSLNPSALPPEQPDPSDSGPSYWLARTVWALGEGYAAWRSVDPDFSAFLRRRLDLAVGALSRQVLSRYGTWLNVDGTRTPAWLIVDGADATAEAVLGLAAAGGYTTVLRRFASGIAALSGGDARTWPFGAVRPWALSLSDWHAWASQMPAALARAATALGDRSLLRPAVTDAATFTPWLLTSGGPDNGRLPTPIDRNQIAYGVDSRLQSLLAVAATTGRDGFRTLAGMVAAWYFGANAAGVPAYDPSTGRTVDGIAPDGTVNHNAGAESTIHGLLSMLALDAHPSVAAVAREGRTVSRAGTIVVSSGTGGTVITPPSAWTGESQYSDGTYISLAPGESRRWTLPPLPQPHLVLPVLDLRPGSPAITHWSSAGRSLGSLRSGHIGPQGASPAPGALLPVTLPTPVHTPDLVSTAARGESLIDAVMLEPWVSRYTVGPTTLLRTASPTPVTVPVPARANTKVYDAEGNLRHGDRAQVLPGGFTVIYATTPGR